MGEVGRRVSDDADSGENRRPGDRRRISRSRLAEGRAYSTYEYAFLCLYLCMTICHTVISDSPLYMSHLSY
jgi:hypothetical protein